MKNRKTVIVAFLLVAVMLLGVGYATLTDTLTIIGNAHIDLDATNKIFDENVYFSDAKPVSSTGSGYTDDVASTSGTKSDDATFTVNKLATVGEKSVFSFTITNDSNADAEIVVNSTKLSGVANPSNSNEPFFKVDYAYPNGMTVDADGGTVDVEVTVTVIKVPTAATAATFGIELTVSSVDPT